MGKDNSGRPTFEPSAAARLMVSVMAAVGTPQTMMLDELFAAKLTKDSADRAILIDRKTLRKYFKAELREGKVRATARMGRTLYMKGLGNGPGAVQAATFWLQTQGVRVDPSWQKVETVQQLLALVEQQKLGLIPGADGSMAKADRTNVIELTPKLITDDAIEASHTYARIVGGRTA